MEEIEEIRRVFERIPIQEGYEKYVSEATCSRDKYNGMLEALMNQYGCATEAEAITGTFIFN